MSVTNVWTNYYLNDKGKLRRRPKSFVPKYLKRSKSFTLGSSTAAVENKPKFNEFSTADTVELKDLFRDWNRSAFFRYKANRDFIGQLQKLDKNVNDSVTKEDSSQFAQKVISPLKPLKFSKKKATSKRPKSELKPEEILAKFSHLISGKVVIVTPNLIVTRTSPTPEEYSPKKVSKY